MGGFRVAYGFSLQSSASTAITFSEFQGTFFDSNTFERLSFDGVDFQERAEASGALASRFAFDQEGIELEWFVDQFPNPPARNFLGGPSGGEFRWVAQNSGKTVEPSQNTVSIGFGEAVTAFALRLDDFADSVRQLVDIDGNATLNTFAVTDFSVDLYLGAILVSSTLVLDDFAQADTFLNPADDWLSVESFSHPFDRILLTSDILSLDGTGAVDTTILSDAWIAQSAEVPAPPTWGLFIAGAFYMAGWPAKRKR